MKNILVHTSLLSALIILTACSAKGYQGIDQPSSATSTVFFEPIGRVSLKQMRIDGTLQGVSQMGITVLPGNHNATLEYQLAMYECPMFSVGCSDNVILGSCDVIISTAADHNYGIELKGNQDTVVLNVYDKQNEASGGSGVCTKNDQRIQGGVMRRRSTIER